MQIKDKIPQMQKMTIKNEIINFNKYLKQFSNIKI